MAKYQWQRKGKAPSKGPASLPSKPPLGSVKLGRGITHMYGSESPPPVERSKRCTDVRITGYWDPDGQRVPLLQQCKGKAKPGGYCEVHDRE